MSQPLRNILPPEPTPPAITRVIVADDHPVVRFGVKNMLMNGPGFQVIGEATDGDAWSARSFVPLEELV